MPNDITLEPEMLKVKPGEKLFPKAIHADLIAPCGMNCGLCMSFLREKNTCAGCRMGDEGKAKSVLACTIRKCETPRSNKSGFCYECDVFPCARLRRLDVRGSHKVPHEHAGEPRVHSRLGN